MPIQAPVGKDAANVRGDVRFVQVMLTDWLLRNGLRGLEINGRVGPEMLAAIKLFEQRYGRDTGHTGGRISPDGATIRRLEEMHLSAMLGGIQVHYAFHGSSHLRPSSARKKAVNLTRMREQYLAGLRRSLG